MQLVYDRLVVAGMSRFIVLDPMHDIDGRCCGPRGCSAGRARTRSSPR